MQPSTAEYLSGLYRAHYAAHPPKPPPEAHRREWGFIPFASDEGVSMHRHKAFASTEDLGDYLRGVGPANCYHSSAYYRAPGAPTMADKGWQGADLIFDLDADHLPRRPEGWSAQLEAVKEETLRLLKFLTGDLGIDEGDLQVVFSGGRGYHVHVRDPRTLGLGAAERRELVDYIGGRLQPEHFLVRQTLQEVYHTGRTIGDVGPKPARAGGSGKGARAGRPPPKGAEGWYIPGVAGSGGGNWPSRIASYLVRKLEELGGLPQGRLEKELQKYNIEKGLERYARDVKRVARSPEALRRISQEGVIDLGKDFHVMLVAMMKESLEEFRVQVGGKTDEPVTADLHRLIRLPGSLHGGSGLLAAPLSLDTLRDFQPLRDALAFGEEQVAVTVLRGVTAELGRRRYRVSPGAGELPQHLAVYLMGRGVAEYGA